MLIMLDGENCIFLKFSLKYILITISEVYISHIIEQCVEAI